MPKSSFFSEGVWHRARIPFLFEGSPTSCSDPLSFWWRSGIVSGSPFSSMALWYHAWILFLLTTFRHHTRIPFLFNGSLASCLDPLSFQRLSGIVSRSPFFLAAFRHYAQIPFLFDGFPAPCSDLYRFDDSLASCPDPFIF